MKPRIFAFIAAALLALTILTNRLSAAKNEDALQNALSRLLSGGTSLAAAIEDGASQPNDPALNALLRKRYESCFADAALKAFLSTGLACRVPLLLHQAGAEVACGSATLESAENAMGYVFTLPIHCACGGESRDFTLTGYAAFAEDRLAALTVGARIRWSAGSPHPSQRIK